MRSDTSYYFLYGDDSISSFSVKFLVISIDISILTLLCDICLLQSHFYWSPKVVLGHPYSTVIDMWLLDYVAVELFLGLPLFPG
jgi:hypothetical protein